MPPFEQNMQPDGHDMSRRKKRKREKHDKESNLTMVIGKNEGMDIKSVMGKEERHWVKNWPDFQRGNGWNHHRNLVYE